MSQENVEIVRRAGAEFDETQRLPESFAPDFVLDTRTYRDLPGQMEYHGRRGFFEFFEQWVDPYDEWDQEIEDVLDAGATQVVAVFRRGDGCTTAERGWSFTTASSLRWRIS
jgi:hypothetical protein